MKKSFIVLTCKILVSSRFGSEGYLYVSMMMMCVNVRECVFSQVITILLLNYIRIRIKIIVHWICHILHLTELYFIFILRSWCIISWLSLWLWVHDWLCLYLFSCSFWEFCEIIIISASLCYDEGDSEMRYWYIFLFVKIFISFSMRRDICGCKY